MTDVRVSIGRLTFDGFALSAADARSARRAVEFELGRLLGQNELPSSLTASGARPRLSRRPLDVGPWRDAGALGSQVAQALYRGFGGRTT
jgi:hypothetical protein